MNLAAYEAAIMVAFDGGQPKTPPENPFESDGFNKPCRCRKGTRPLACDAKQISDRRADRKKERRNRRMGRK